MRSESETPSICEETDVKVICAVEEAAEEYKDCPAACRKDNSKADEKEDTVVKSGDLAVTASAAEGKKVLQTGISDMDTLTFKTSENVEITKITLERYGYNSDGTDKIKGIWLEDEDGNVIAESKTLSKDKVTLNIKKDYRAVDGTYVATIVVQTDGASLGTIGFKVTDVESTAKNLNVDNYDPYTYEIINYTGSGVTVEKKGSDKNYNYEEGKSYEIARLKVKASSKDILVKGFTLTNKLITTGADKDTESALDMKNFLDEVTVTVDSKEIKAKATANKNDELVVTFNEDVEIAMNKSALFVVSASFTDFDAYGEAVRYEISNNSDFNAVEKKNGTRVELTNSTKPGYKHVFAGGKIKLSNTRLGNVDAAQASEGIVVAEGNITITEPISKLNFTVYAKNLGAQYINRLTMDVNGEEYDVEAPAFSTYSNTADYVIGDVVIKDDNKIYRATTKGKGSAVTWEEGLPFEFKNVDIEKSGKIQFKVDIKDPETAIAGTPQIDFVGNFGKAAFDGSKYDTSNKPVKQDDVAGSISYSKVTIQPAKASLNNKLTKDVEFLRNETSAKKVVLEGEYTAKKGDIELNKFYIMSSASYVASKNKPTFYLYIDDMDNPVADTDVINASTVKDKTANTESFSDVSVEAGKTVKVKVEVEVEAYEAKDTTKDNLGKFTVVILGTDVNGNEDTGRGSAKTVTMKVVDKGSATISAGTSKNTVLKKASGAELAQFTIKPSKGASEIELEDLSFVLVKGNNGAVITSEDDLTIKVGTTPLDDCSFDSTSNKVSCSITNETIPSEGKTVSIVLDEEVTGTVTLTLDRVNGKEVTNKFVKRFESALVSIDSQTNNNGTTTFVLGVDNDDDLTITHLQIRFDTPLVEKSTADKDLKNQYYDVVSDGDDLTDIKGVKDTPRLVEEISYYVKKGGDYDTDTKCTAGGGTPYHALPAADAYDGTAAGEYEYCKISILRSQYADFFKIGGQNVQAFASNK